ncbi:MAG: discoidin domain-containing protein [Candidatus Heimdallarchaeota archaeon]|nr:discoidin domain-containing protein [Candidatus Heimdallarchaeota archaeon]
MVHDKHKVLMLYIVGILIFQVVNTSAIISYDENQNAEPQDTDTYRQQIPTKHDTELQIDNAISVGLGSYTETLPEGATAPPSEIWKSQNYEGPVQTGDWISSVLFEPFSQPLYAHPMAYRAVENGLEMGFPSFTGAGYFLHRADFVVGSSVFNPDNATLEHTSDWFADINMANGAQSLVASIGHGSPFAYFNLNAGDATLTFDGDITVFYLGNQYIGITTHYGNSFGIFLPSGSSISGAVTGSRLISIALSETYFSIVGLPDNTEASLLYYAAYAYAFVTDTQVSWDVDEKGSVITTYEVITTVKEGNNTSTIMALYPHQWRDNDLSYLSFTYPTIRGIMKVIRGNSFQTSYRYSGILPMFPEQSNFDNILLSNLVDEAITGLDLRPVTDTYWGGKEVGRLAQLLPIAEQMGNSIAVEMILSSLKSELQKWLTAGGNEEFYYDKTWGTLIGYPASFGSDTDLNDHHFHYGYWIQAAAAIAIRDKVWAAEENWGGMINLLIRDIAASSREDKMFPILRNYDIYEGHSWASGTAQYDAGNNQESSSESINAWASLILWGEATGNTTIRDTGIYLYTTEVQAINNYYFDLYDDVFTDSYEYSCASLVFGGKYEHATWFSPNAHMIHGIIMLPITPASIYLGMDPSYVMRNYEEAYEEDSSEIWADILTEYLALSDPTAAILKANTLNMWDMNSDFRVEEGDSKAHSYHWVHSLDHMGLPDFETTANTTLYNVFTKGVQRTYVVYNAKDTPISVKFSDGFIITNIAANSLISIQNITGPAYSLFTNVVGSGSISPSSGSYAEGSELEISAFAAQGWTFDHWEGDLSGNENPTSMVLNGNKSITAVFEENAANGNLAFEKPVTVSSVESDNYPGSNAVDGIVSTRWSSEFNDPQWIYVDLLKIHIIQMIVLNWENAYASSYEIQLSNDSNNWETIYTSSNSNGGIDEIYVAELRARFVRMFGLDRATEYGYSIYEFEVYGRSGVQYSLTTNLVGSGYVSPSYGIYDEGTSVTITASTISGWRFDHWEGDVTGNVPTINVIMDSHKNITAYFLKISESQSNDSSISANMILFGMIALIVVNKSRVSIASFKRYNK